MNVAARPIGVRAKRSVNVPGKNNAQVLGSLQGDAKDVATRYLEAFPDALLLSGGRSAEEQAWAMARACFKKRDFILGDEAGRGAVYRWSVGASLLHRWSIAHPHAPLSDIAVAFATILHRLTPAQREAVSMHFAGAAFDPKVGTEAQRLWLHAEAARLGGTFLEEEGGLTQWHWQAKKSGTVTRT